MRSAQRLAIFLLTWLVSTVIWAQDGRTVVVLSQKSSSYERVAHVLQQQASAHKQALDIIGVEDLPKVDDASVRVYVSVGSLATQAVVSYTQGKPVLAVMITRSAYEALHTRAGQFAAILLEQPPERVLALAQVLLPTAQRFGLLAGSKADSVVPGYVRAAEKMEIQTSLAHVEDEENAALAINFLLDESEGIIALPDPMMMKPNAAKWLLYMAYQQNAPVIGFSQAYVKAGALAAAYSTPEDLAQQAGEWLLSYLSNGKNSRLQSYYPIYFNVAVNRWVARSLRVKADSDAQLVQQVNEMTRGPMP